MSFTPEQIAAGHAVYTKGMLRIYDFLVLGLSNSLIWHCPSKRLLAHYNRHVSANHLDAGPGTGFFLDRCQFPSLAPRVALLDLNQNALAFSAQRIERYRPEIYIRNVLEPITLDAPKFDSIGMSYLLHCLPGAIGAKSVAFDHLKSLMAPGAVIFGATLLQGGVERSFAARRLMGFYNRKGIFSNSQDTLEGLRSALERRFKDTVLEVAGCAALFSGRA
ncbi:MAG TPA: class I SAM-dependent methyltransferase [Methylocella sp.]|nr:class I SAM-dependent methyltransferase [Methylocella sp.]